MMQFAKHLEHASRLPTWQSAMHLYPVNGKVHRVSQSDTAFGYRDAVWSGVIVGVDPDPANRERITAWARAYYDALHPFGAGGAYLNFMMDEGEDRIRAAYRANYPRLAAIKAKYDPKFLPREPEHPPGRIGRRLIHQLYLGCDGAAQPPDGGRARLLSL